MGTVQADEYAQVVGTVRSWPSELRLSLAEELLRTLYPELRRSGPRGVPAEQVRGIGAGKSPPPDDETVKKWIEEHRMEKHG